MNLPETETTATQNSIFENPYDKEVLSDNWKYGSGKTMKTLLIVGAIFFFSDLLALSVANALDSSTIVYALLVPLLYAALGFLGKAKPLLAAVLGIVLFVLVMIVSVSAMGSKALVSGWFFKAAVIYFLFKAFTYAKEAEEAKKKLKNL